MGFLEMGDFRKLFLEMGDFRSGRRSASWKVGFHEKWDFKNKDYIEYRKSLLADHSDHKNSDKSTGNPEETHDINVPPPQRGRGKANAKHLLVAPKLFKEMLMVCQTEKGKQVRIIIVCGSRNKNSEKEI